jgi:hypothetical protein
MLILKLATAGLLGMVAVSALAQAPPIDSTAGYRAGLQNGDRDSLPRSNQASNITPNGTAGTSAPTLPASALGTNAGSRDYLRAARASLAAGHTGKAQQSLEMAETRALGGSSSPDVARSPSGNAKVTEIRDALHALGEGDRVRAMKIIDVALNN